MAKLPEGRSTLTDEQMIGLTHRLVDTCIDCKARIEVLIAERDEAWKRAAHAEKMWGKAEVKLSEARMSDYKQTRDAAGRVTSTFGKMLEGLTDDDLIDHIESLEKRLNAAYLKMDVLEDQIEKLQKAKGGKDE